MMEYIEDIKECRTCGIEKSYTEFHKDGGRKDGIESRCKNCQRAKARPSTENRNNRLKSKYNVPDKCVYAFVENNEIVYIGESHTTSKRINDHYGDNFVSFCKELNSLERKKRFGYTILWYGDNDEYRKYQEKELINLHKPKYNKIHKL